MKKKVTQVEEIPINVNKNSTLEINTINLGYFTHSYFKYPCKFIPHIPRWAINKYTKENEFVLDCFAGSGTTLVESVLLNRNAFGVDFDKLSQLLCITKTTLLSDREIMFIRNNLNKFISGAKSKKTILPDIHNINHWFSDETIKDLSVIKANIESISNKRVKNFLFVSFASIIKKVSFADDNSPKPYISRRFPKKPLHAKELYIKTVNSNLNSIEKFKNNKLGKAEIIAYDAREINIKELFNKIDLAVTSPPYINAFDYVRSLRLENAWLDYFGDSNISEIKRKQIGTENISSLTYLKQISPTGIKKLDDIINNISKTDKKRAYIVFKFFDDMQKNISSVRKLLKTNSHYIIVIGDSKIRKIEVPTHNILIEIAEKNGFKLDNVFSYVIKNRYLRIPRGNRGGLIKQDWVIDLRKN